MDDHDIQIHYSGEWAALYVDGKLEVVGDNYLAEERAFELLGVRQVQDDAFMRGQTSRDGVAKTLADVESYRASRKARGDKAQELRDEAMRLITEADKLDPQYLNQQTIRK